MTGTPSEKVCLHWKDILKIGLTHKATAGFLLATIVLGLAYILYRLFTHFAARFKVRREVSERPR
jgi:hypothetical protein